MKIPKFLQRQVEAAALEAFGKLLDNAIEESKDRTWRLNLLNTGAWVDLGDAQTRLLRGLRGAVERRKAGGGKSSGKAAADSRKTTEGDREIHNS
jgi:hypothetical protein